MTDVFEPYRAPAAPLSPDHRTTSSGRRIGIILAVPCFWAGLMGIMGLLAGVAGLVQNRADLRLMLSVWKGIVGLFAIGIFGVAGVLSLDASRAFFRGRWRRATICSILGFTLLGVGMVALRWFVAH
jgi:hypothetical protein